MLMQQMTRCLQRLYRATALFFAVVFGILGLLSLPILGPTPGTLICLVLSPALALAWWAMGLFDWDVWRQRILTSARTLIKHVLN